MEKLTIEDLQTQLLDKNNEIQKLKEDNKSLSDNLTKEKNKYTDYESTTNKKISDLQEHNQKLYLRLTSDNVDNSLKTQTNEEYTSNLMDTKILSNEEKEILRELEGDL